MNDNLAARLIRKQVLTTNTVVVVMDDVKYVSEYKKMPVEFIVDKIDKDSTGKIIYTLSGHKVTKEIKHRTAVSEDIMYIDGMDPILVALAYGVNDSGENNVTGKRRGRPRKWFRPEL